MIRYRGNLFVFTFHVGREEVSSVEKFGRLCVIWIINNIRKTCTKGVGVSQRGGHVYLVSEISFKILLKIGIIQEFFFYVFMLTVKVNAYLHFSSSCLWNKDSSVPKHTIATKFKWLCYKTDIFFLLLGTETCTVDVAALLGERHKIQFDKNLLKVENLFVSHKDNVNERH